MRDHWNSLSLSLITTMRSFSYFTAAVLDVAGWTGLGIDGEAWECWLLAFDDYERYLSMKLLVG
jgi:hypothetical protein